MKKMNKKGFTLMEMLIVIAIIAILIAIAIPTFTAALEKSRAKTDLANARALKSLVLTKYMDGDDATFCKKLDDATDSATVTFYLSKNGQSIVDTAGTGCMPATAKANKGTGDDAYINCVFGANTQYKGGNPNITTNLPS